MNLWIFLGSIKSGILQTNLSLNWWVLRFNQSGILFLLNVPLNAQRWQVFMLFYCDFSFMREFCQFLQERRASFVIKRVVQCVQMSRVPFLNTHVIESISSSFEFCRRDTSWRHRLLQCCFLLSQVVEQSCLAFGYYVVPIATGIIDPQFIRYVVLNRLLCRSNCHQDT